MKTNNKKIQQKAAELYELLCDKISNGETTLMNVVMLLDFRFHECETDEVNNIVRYKFNRMITRK